MKRYWTVLRVERPWWTYGVTVDRSYWKPSFESWTGGEWYIQGLGLSLWRHDRTPMTVAERGVW